MGRRGDVLDRRPLDEVVVLDRVRQRSFCIGSALTSSHEGGDVSVRGDFAIRDFLDS